MLSRVDQQRNFFKNFLGLTGEQVASKSLADLEQEYYEAQSSGAGASAWEEVVRGAPGAGEWVSIPGTGITAVGGTLDRLCLTPFLASEFEDVICDRVAMETTTAPLGSGGCITKVGLYNNVAGNKPGGDPIIQFPDVAHAAAGIHETAFAAPFTFLKNKVYWVGSVIQVVASPAFRSIAANELATKLATAIGTQNTLSYRVEAVSGALPNIAAPIRFGGAVPRVQFRRVP